MCMILTAFRNAENSISKVGNNAIETFLRIQPRQHYSNGGNHLERCAARPRHEGGGGGRLLGEVHDDDDGATFEFGRQTESQRSPK